MKGKSSLAMFVLPAVLFVSILTVIPILVTFGISLTSYSVTHPESTRFIGFQNYTRLLQDSRFINSIRVTLLLIAIPVSIQMFIGLFLAIALNENLFGIRWLRSFFITPAVLPPVVIGLIWKIFLLPRVGGLNYFLGLIGIHGPDWLGTPSNALWAVIMASVWSGIPFVTLMYLSTLETIPVSYYEAAAIDGASWWQINWFIAIPMLKKVSKVVVIFRVLEALGIFPIIFVLTGGGPGGATEPINFYAYTAAFSYLRFDTAATLIVVFFVFLFLLSWPILRSIGGERQ